MKSRDSVWPIFILWLVLACNPIQDKGDKRETGHRESDLVERTADVSVPVSGTNLVFSVDDDVDLETVDAYIVGYPESLTARRLRNKLFIIENVPSGSRELIVTGLSRAESADSLSFDRGLRLPQNLIEGKVMDLGNFSLPKTGQLEGRLEMAGVSPFTGLSLTLPGTKIKASSVTVEGSYLWDNLPVGQHLLATEQQLNPKPAETRAEVLSSQANAQPRMLVYSQPNTPTNLEILGNNNKLLLSWNAGDADTQEYMVVKYLEGQLPFKPVAGKSYKLGTTEGGDIVYLGKTPYFADAAVKNGTRYLFAIFALNKDLVYSEPLKGEGIPKALDYAYPYYRVVFDSSASSCDNFGGIMVQQLRFQIDNLWQLNDFSANTPNGKIGPYPAVVSANSTFNNAYEAFYAFQANNSPWSSEDFAFALTDPFDVDRTKFANGVYIGVQFNTPVMIAGLEILGGEPPFYLQCAPDRYHMEGSLDGLSYVLIPGSTRSQSTIERVRYSFAPQARPLTPTRLDLLANKGQVELLWEKAAGNETGFLLARSKTPVPFLPEAGRPYNIGSQGAYEIVYTGAETSFLDTALEDKGTVYYYTLLAFDAGFQYSKAIVGRAVPEAREAYRYHRLVVDSILGGDAISDYLAWVSDLKVQIDGVWVEAYNFTAEKGSIGSFEVAVSQSSFSENDKGWRVFGAGQWRSSSMSFGKIGQSPSILKPGEWIQLDFGASKAAITGYRIFGNDATDPATQDFSETMFAQVPDGMHWEVSSDGQQWTSVPGSASTSLAAEVITVSW